MQREELQIFVYVSIRQHTAAYGSRRQHTCRSSSNFVAKWLKAIAHKAIAVRVATAST